MKCGSVFPGRSLVCSEFVADWPSSKWNLNEGSGKRAKPQSMRADYF